jgi:hypothetical protein
MIEPSDSSTDLGSKLDIRCSLTIAVDTPSWSLRSSQVFAQKRRMPDLVNRLHAVR